MRICMGPEDLQSIADAVVRKIAPLILKSQESLEHNISLKVENIKIKQPASINTSKPGGEIIRRKELCLITGLSATTIWRLENEGKFPARIRLTNNRVGWRRSDVNNWLLSRRTIKGQFDL